ncbi:hypothetical protein ACFVWN_20520 [Nocardiopsis flavescens]|uniref:hypothetical protein n=1 Tax=Nocardiopsis flavescens TaxID=758803 RepID=UPI0036573B46
MSLSRLIAAAHDAVASADAYCVARGEDLTPGELEELDLLVAETAVVLARVRADIAARQATPGDLPVPDHIPPEWTD